MLVANDVHELIATFFRVEPFEFDSDTKLTRLGADSLDAVELAMDLEQKFKIKLRDNAFSEDVTVQDVVNLVTSQMQA